MVFVVYKDTNLHANLANIKALTLTELPFYQVQDFVLTKSPLQVPLCKSSDTFYLLCNTLKLAFYEKRSLLMPHL